MGCNGGGVSVELPAYAHLSDPPGASLSLRPEIDIFRSLSSSSSNSSARREEEHPQSQPSTSRSTFTCHYEVCGKSFSRAAKLSEHLNTHTGDRPFVCSHDGCSASYRSSSKLQAHEKTHLSMEEQEKSKSFICECKETADGTPCNKRFWTRQHLSRHIEGVHGLGDATAGSISSNSKSYCCVEPGCEAVYSKRKKLREHVWAVHADQASHHTDEQEENSTSLPFPCQYPECKRRFATNAKRRAHFKTHTEARYTCALPHDGDADQILTFANWSALQAHMREAHPPTCPYPSCNGKTFKNKDNLKLHLRRHEEKEAEALADGADDAAREGGGGDASNVQDGYDCTGLRSFRCDWRPDGDDGNDAAAVPCTKVFKSLHAMKTHIRVAHLKERPYACPCGKSYGHRHLLKRHGAKCAQSASVQEAGDSDDEDAIFRQGGGALPDALRGEGGSSGQSPSRKRKQGHGDTDQPWDRSGSKMVDLLTGASYAGSRTENEPAGKKRRQMRGRVVSCPWPRLQRLLAQRQREEGAADPLPEGMQECAHCFSRVYDVRRHLQSKHHVMLDDGEVRALLDESEVAQLAPPRAPPMS